MKARPVNIPKAGTKGFVAIPIQRRIWTKIKKSKKCWVWIGAKNEHGYGQVKLDGKMRGAHRVMFSLWNGEIPLGKNVLHRCDNPPCVKPSHLFIGTHTDNMRDMFAKGRGNPRGWK